MEYKVSDKIQKKFDTLTKDAKVQKALQFMENDQNEIINRQIELTLIPAPTNHEQKKAARLLEMFKEEGLTDCHIDEYGNCTVHREIGPLDVTAQAQACKNSGGKVIVQVEKIVQGGSLDPKLVAIPGIYVDSVVVGTEEENMQCLGMPYDGALTGEFRIPVDAIPPIPMDAKKIIARRAAMELPKLTLSSTSAPAHRRRSLTLQLRKAFPTT